MEFKVHISILGSKRGVSLVLVMGIMVILGILATTLIVISSTQSSVTSYTRWHKIALNAAEAGIAVGTVRVPFSIEPFPNPPAIWDTLPNGALYKSGAPDSVPTPLKIAELNKLIPGYSVNFVFNNYKIRVSGKAGRAQRGVEAKVRCGPLPRGTSY